MKVAVVAGIVVESDAISAAVATQAALLAQLWNVDDVVVFAQHIDRVLPCESHVVGSSWELVRHRQFRDADVAIFHWGIHYDLFGAVLLLTNAAPRAVCHFHNCTPEILVSKQHRDLIRSSLSQAQLMVELEMPVWTYSPYNKKTLIDWGVPERQISFVPFPIDAPRPLVPRRTPQRVDALVVGRIVAAKGVHVVLEALAHLAPEVRDRVTVHIVGNTQLSHDDYLDQLMDLVRTGGLERTVVFEGHVDDDRLWDLYEQSDLLIAASFHEGLCVPVVEAYLAGCRVIGTSAGNLAYIVLPPDPIVAPDDPVALAAALTQVVDEIRRGLVRDSAPIAELTSSFSSTAVRLALGAAIDAMVAPARSC